MVITDLEKNVFHHNTPVAVAISGGLDSAVILHCLSEKGNNINTFSMKWGDNTEESDYANRLSEAYGCSHTDIIFTKEEYQIALKDCMRCFDRPRWNIWPWMIAKKAYMVGCNILYIGEGSDDILGYSDRSYIRGWICQLEYIYPVWEQVCEMWGLDLHAPFLELETSISENYGQPQTLPLQIDDKKSILWAAYKEKIKAPVIYPKKAALHYYDILGKTKKELLVDATKLWLSMQ